jgi:NADH-quinone oxidoreductase subunit G
MSPACATQVGDGMEIGLYTPEAEKARRAVIEFWLLNHPLDCPVCDQGGECPLQDIAFDHGPGVSRLVGPKVKKRKRVNLGPHVVLDEERCILCWRCTRFTQEISGTNQIMLNERGVYTTVGTPPGITFDDPYSGNVVDLCPVGALTSHDFRFKSRVWEMSSTEGVCTACALGCNTYVWSKKGKVERLTSRPNLLVNDYWLCDRGRFDIGFVNDANRITLPLLRVEDRFVPVEWSEGLHAFTQGLGSVAGRGHNQAAAILSPDLSNEELWAFQKFVRSGLGSNHVLSGRREVLTPARADLVRRGRTLRSVTDLEKVDGILVVGGNLERTHPVLALRVRKALRRYGVQLLLATPDPDRLDGEAVQVERVPREKAAAWLQETAGRVGQGAEGIAGRLAGLSRVAVIVNAGEENAAVAEGLDVFLESGPKDAAWRALFLDEGGNAAGAWNLGVSPSYYPGMKAIAPEEAHVWKTRWGGRVTGEPGHGWEALMEAAAAEKIRALLLVNSGRPRSWQFTAEEKAALARIPFVVAFDFSERECREFAHLVLPAPSFAEMDGTFTTPDGVVQLARRNIVPRVWTPLQILYRGAGTLGYRMKSEQPVDVFRELARDVPAYEGLDYGSVSRNRARTEPVKSPVGAGA